MTVPAIFSSTSSVISASVGFIIAVVLGFMKKGLVTVAVSASLAVFLTDLLLTFL